MSGFYKKMMHFVDHNTFVKVAPSLKEIETNAESAKKFVTSLG